MSYKLGLRKTKYKYFASQSYLIHYHFSALDKSPHLPQDLFHPASNVLASPSSTTPPSRLPLENSRLAPPPALSTSIPQPSPPRHLRVRAGNRVTKDKTRHDLSARGRSCEVSKCARLRLRRETSGYQILECACGRIGVLYGCENRD